MFLVFIVLAIHFIHAMPESTANAATAERALQSRRARRARNTVADHAGIERPSLKREIESEDMELERVSSNGKTSAPALLDPGFLTRLN